MLESAHLAKATITFHSVPQEGRRAADRHFFVSPASSPSSSHPQFELAIFQIEFIMNLRANEVFPPCLSICLSVCWPRLFENSPVFTISSCCWLQYRLAVSFPAQGPSIVNSPVSSCWKFKIIFCNYILLLMLFVPVRSGACTCSHNGICFVLITVVRLATDVCPDARAISCSPGGLFNLLVVVKR